MDSIIRTRKPIKNYSAVIEDTCSQHCEPVIVEVEGHQINVGTALTPVYHTINASCLRKVDQQQLSNYPKSKLKKLIGRPIVVEFSGRHVGTFEALVRKDNYTFVKIRTLQGNIAYNVSKGYRVVKDKDDNRLTRNDLEHIVGKEVETTPDYYKLRGEYVRGLVKKIIH